MIIMIILVVIIGGCARGRACIDGTIRQPGRFRDGHAGSLARDHAPSSRRRSPFTVYYVAYANNIQK